MNLRRKSRGLSLALTFFFGPVGMFYSSVPLAFVFIISAMVVPVMTHTLMIFPILIVGIIVADSEVRSHNKSVDEYFNTRGKNE